MEMTARVAIAAAIKVTIVLLMVSLGLQTTHRDLLRLWRRPRLLVGCLIAAFVVVPVAAYAVFHMLPLSFAAKVGLWVVAITPGAPMIYRAALKRGVGDPGLAASFQVSVALLVVIFAPVWLAIISALSGGHYWIPPLVVLKQVSTIQLIPVLVGLSLRRWLPRIVGQAGKVLTLIGNIGLLVLIAMLLVVLGPRVIAGREAWTILAAALIAAAALAGGHLLAGPGPVARVTIANANVQRNIGLALAIATWNLPEQKAETVVVIATYILVAVVAAAVYTSVYKAFGAQATTAREGA